MLKLIDTNDTNNEHVILELSDYQKLVSLASGNKAIVHCEDCEHCIIVGKELYYCMHRRNRNPYGCNPLDYCSDGKERKA